VSDFFFWIGLFVCSGDTDAVVPLTATRYSIDALNLPTVVSWYPWYDAKEQVSFIVVIVPASSIASSQPAMHALVYVVLCVILLWN
jgi:hypothetical protein